MSVSRVKYLDPDSMKEQWTPGCPQQQLPTLLTHNIRVSQEWSHLILRVWRIKWTPGCQRQQFPKFTHLQYTSVSRVKSLDPDSRKEHWTPGCPRQQLPTLLTHNIPGSLKSEVTWSWEYERINGQPGCPQRQQFAKFAYSQYTSVSRVK